MTRTRSHAPPGGSRRPFLLLLLPVLLAGAADAQWGGYYENRETVYSVPELPTVQGLVTRVAEGIQWEEWSVVIASLQELIDEYPSIPISVGQLSEEGDGRSGPGVHRFLGARHWAYQALAELPAAGREAYRERYDPEARRLYRGVGLPPRDREAALVEVARRFLYTSFGPRALELLAELTLERGELEASLYWLRQLLPFLRAGEPASAAALARTAIVSAWLGQEQDLPELRGWAARLDLLGLPDPRRGEAGTVQDMLIELMPTEEVPGVSQWPSLAGAPSGGRPAAASARPDALRWYAPLPTRWRPMDQLVQEMPGQRRHATPTLVPSVEGGVAYVTNGLEVAAYDIWTGNRRWRTPGFLDESEATTGDENLLHAVAVGEDVVIAPLEVRSGMSPRVWNYTYEIIRPIPRRILAAFKREDGSLLWTTDTAAAEGRLSQRELDREASTTDLRFPSPALVVGDVVYAVGVQYDVNFNYYAVALDAGSGQLLWRTHLSSGLLEQNMFGNAVREAFPSQPVLQGGVLYACTNHGVVAALDQLQGNLRWCTTYTPTQMPVNKSFETRVRGGQWAPTPPLVSRGVLVVAPTDCDRALALDAADGSLLWGRQRGRDLEQLVGVAPGPGGEPALYLTGDRLLVVLGLVNGRPLGDSPIRIGTASRDEIIGRPALSREQVYLPTREGIEVRSTTRPEVVTRQASWSELVRTGARRPSSTLVYGLAGNLVVADGILLCGGRTHVGALYRWETVYQALQEELARHPEDAALQLKLGSVSYQRASSTVDGEEPLQQHLADAAEHYQAALRLAPRVSSNRRAQLVSAARSGLYHVRSLQARRLAHEGEVDEAVRLLVEEAAAHAPNDQQKVQAYLDGAELLVLARRHEDAIALYHRLARDLGGASCELPDQTNCTAAVLALVRVAEEYTAMGRPGEATASYQALLAQHAGELYEGSDCATHAERAIETLIDRFGRDAAYSEQDVQAQERFASLRQSGDLDGMRRLVATYPNARVTPQVHLELGRRLLVDPDRREQAMDHLRQALRRRGASDAAAAAAALLVQAHEEAGDLVQARGWLLYLRDVEPEGELEVGEDTVRAGDYARARLDSDAYRQLGETATRRLDLPVSPTPLLRLEEDPLVEPPLLLFVAGASPFAVGEPIFLARDHILEAYRTREAGWAWDPVDLGRRPVDESAARYCGGHLVIVVEDGVVCLDPHRGQLLWSRRQEDYTVRGFAAADDLVVILRRHYSGSRPTEVLAFSPRDGALLWQDPELPQTSAFPDLRIAGSLLLITDLRRGVTHWYEGRTGRVVNRVEENVGGLPVVVSSRHRVVMPMIVGGASTGRRQPWVFDLETGRLLEDQVPCPPLSPERGVEAGGRVVFPTRDYRSFVVLDPGQGEESPAVVEDCGYELSPGEIYRTDYRVPGLRALDDQVYLLTEYSDRSRNSAIRLCAFQPSTGESPWPPLVLCDDPFVDLEEDSVLVAGTHLAAVFTPARRGSLTDTPPSRLVVADLEHGTVAASLDLPANEPSRTTPVARFVDGGITVWHQANLYFFGSPR